MLKNLNRFALGCIAALALLLSVVSPSLAENFSNFALTTLASSIGSTDTTLTVASTTNFPTSAPFRITIQDSATSTPEIDLVTGISGNTYTVTRGYENTTATAHSAGAQVAQFVTAGVITDIYSKLGGSQVTGLTYNSTGAAGTNKTLIQNALNAGGHVIVDCPPTIASETDTVPASPYQQSVANAGVFFISDQGVKYASSGTSLTKVASAPSTGQYAVSTGGVYTFASGDSGGSVTISYNWMAPAWLNGHLTIGSNTKLEAQPTCHFEQASGANDNMLVNAAYLAPWTTQYNNSGIVANGPLAMIWQGNTPAWSSNSGSGKAYVQGNYVVANGNIYWENATSCTGATSGTGPSGNSGTSTGPTGTTGAAITDGTCSWYYVTIATAGIENLNATVYYPNNGLQVGSYVAITPQPDNNTTNAWTGSQTAHTRGGPCDSAYFGTFYVSAVNDSNYVTVTLKRPPGAAFSGIPMNMKPADHDIYIGGGATWDYNYSNNTSAGGQKGVVTLLSSIGNLMVDGYAVANYNSGYGLEFNGLNGFELKHARSLFVNINSDLLKVYGSFDGVIDGLTMAKESNNGEISLQTDEVGAFTSEVISSQDLLNIKLSNVHLHNDDLAIYAVDPNLLTDNITIDGVSSDSLNSGAASSVNIVGSITGTASNIGTISLKNIDVHGLSDTGNSSGTFVLQNLLLDNYSNSMQLSGSTSDPGIFHVLSGSLIRNVVIRNFKWDVNTGRYLNIDSGAEIDNITARDGYIFSYSNSTNALFIAGPGCGGTVKNVNIDSVYELGAIGAWATSLCGTEATFTNNYSNQSITGFTFAGGTNYLKIGNNQVSGMVQGMARFNATATVNLYSSGGNHFYNSSVWWSFPTGTDTAASYGWDIQCDVTKMGRITGEYCFNTNTSPGSGTLTTSGPVMDQGTSANSWFLMSNPSGQQY